MPISIARVMVSERGTWPVTRSPRSCAVRTIASSERSGTELYTLMKSTS